MPAQIEQAEATAADNARRRALELQAQVCNNAADACWYLACSLGAARDLPPGEASMELLFQLIGALADLPAEIASAALPEVVGGRDDGIAELCHQLEAARESAGCADRGEAGGASGGLGSRPTALRRPAHAAPNQIAGA